MAAIEAKLPGAASGARKVEGFEDIWGYFGILGFGDFGFRV